MTIKLATAAIAASLLASAANAETAAFTGGVATPSAGFTIINRFDNTNGLTGNNFQTQLPPANSTGAPPANSVPSGTSYLSILGGGSATYSLAAFLPGAIQFDWGSLDTYNTLTIRTTLGNIFAYIPGQTNFPGTTDADGNQMQPDTNGRFTFSLLGQANNERVSSVTFASSANSFEVDNFAVAGAVPEPASWALMIGGFGVAGVAMRRRRKTTDTAFA